MLIAMAQPALDKYVDSLKEDGVLIFDSDLVKPDDRPNRRLGLPAMELARQTFGREVVANVIMLGCLGGVTGVVSHESLRKAITERASEAFAELDAE